MKEVTTIGPKFPGGQLHGSKSWSQSQVKPRKWHGGVVGKASHLGEALLDANDARMDVSTASRLTPMQPS